MQPEPLPTIFEALIRLIDKEIDLYIFKLLITIWTLKLLFPYVWTSYISTNKSSSSRKLDMPIFKTSSKNNQVKNRTGAFFKIQVKQPETNTEPSLCLWKHSVLTL